MLTHLPQASGLWASSSLEEIGPASLVPSPVHTLMFMCALYNSVCLWREFFLIFMWIVCLCTTCVPGVRESQRRGCWTPWNRVQAVRSL